MKHGLYFGSFLLLLSELAFTLESYPVFTEDICRAHSHCLALLVEAVLCA